MVKYLLMLLLAPVGGFAEAATSDSLRPTLVLPLRADYATADHLSNIYVLTDNTVIKFDSTGRKVAEYSNRRQGNAAFIDASNPLKIMVLYPEFQTAVLLDRTLTEMGRIKFSDLGYTALRTAGATPDGNIWVYDDIQARAAKLDLSGAILFESRPLNALFPHGFSPARIRDNGQQVFLNDPDHGLCILDQYAQVIAIDPFSRISDFETDGDWLVYVRDGNVCFDQRARHQVLQTPVPGLSASSHIGYWLGNKRLFVQSGNELRVFQW